MLRPLGVSDIQHYYMSGSEQNPFDSCSHVTLTADLDRDALQRAAAAALQQFPELAYRPVLSEGTVWATPNDAPVPLLDDDGSVRHYGTDETAGYMFALSCRKDGFSLSNFHGLTDFNGIWRFTRTLLYNYAVRKGLSVNPDEWVRTDCDTAPVMDALERYNPCRKFNAPSGVAPAAPAAPAEAFAIPESFVPSTERSVIGQCLTCSLASLLHVSKLRQTSVAALLSWAFSRALTQLYDTAGLPIVTMLPASMRRVFGTQTVSNFDYPIIMSYDATVQALPLEEQASALRGQMKAQMDREHYLAHIASKIKRIEGMINGEEDICQWNRRLAQPLPAGTKVPFTLALTYPGDMSLPAAYAPLVRGVTRRIYASFAMGLGILAYTYGDTLYIQTSRRFESDAIMRSVLGLLQAEGIPAELMPAECYLGNVAVCERFITAEQTKK